MAVSGAGENAVMEGKLVWVGEGLVGVWLGRCLPCTHIHAHKRARTQAHKHTQQDLHIQALTHRQTHLQAPVHLLLVVVCLPYGHGVCLGDDGNDGHVAAQLMHVPTHYVWGGMSESDG